MGTAARGQFPALIEDLLRQGPTYDFFQAMRLLEHNGSGTVGENHRGIGFRPAPQLSFPAGEIRRCEVDAGGRIWLELNFMGLFGVDSPLPHFFLDIAATDEPSGELLREFLALFNQRLYQLVYLAWKKFHLHAPPGGPVGLYERYLLALQGLERSGSSSGRLDYAGLVGGRVKNAAGLGDLLADYLGQPVQVRQFVPVWVEIGRGAGLGAGLRLGDNALLGERMVDVSRKISIQVGPLPAAEALQLLPGRPRALALARLIRQYLVPTLEFEVELLLRPDAEEGAALGRNEAPLGWTTCLGRPVTGHHRIVLAGNDIRRQSPLQPEV